MILLQNISKKYADKVVLKDINLQIQDGEIYGLIGRNGVGKTTLLNIMSGITNPTSGTCMIDTKKVIPGSLAEGHIGYLPDLPNFYDFLTGKEYFQFLNSARKNKQDDMIQHLISLADFDMNSKIKNLSRGNRQKLGIMAAVLAKPKVLLLDEPTSALDPVGRKETMNMIKDLKSSGMTIVLSTHILNDLELVCDKVGFLHNGIIARELDLHHETDGNLFFEIIVDKSNINSVINLLLAHIDSNMINYHDDTIFIRQVQNGKIFTWNQLFTILSCSPIQIRKIELRRQHNLEEEMEEVLNS